MAAAMEITANRTTFPNRASMCLRYGVGLEFSRISLGTMIRKALAWSQRDLAGDGLLDASIFDI